MSDPFDWPALAGAPAQLGEALHCAVGIWGKVHGAASDYRWIARSEGFGGGLPDLHRRLRIGAEDLGIRTTAWRAPGAEAGGQDYFAIGTYPSRAQDAAGRGAVLEKRVLHWRSPAAGFAIALAAAALLPAVADGDDGAWWGRVGEGDWQQPDYALPLGPESCPRLVLGRAALDGVIAAGIDALSAVLDQPRLAALYTGLLAGWRPVVLGGQPRPLPPAALVALLLPLSPGEVARCSLCAWVPASLIDPADLGRNWDLVVTRQAGPPTPAAAPADLERGAVLAAALLARAPGRIAGGSAPLVFPPPPIQAAVVAAVPISVDHPNPRMHLEPFAAATWPGLGYLYEFADRVNLRRLDLARLAQDLTAPAAYPLLPPDEDPVGHPLVGWIATLTRRRPDWVDAAEWGFKIDQLRAAALCLLPHPGTLDLVGLPLHPAVPALLAVLAA
ncbi:hypothetical protein, partial [uncultured Thiodictyon sp.]|uniref:hypothetical protein n=1 Tax=uncultured Thiodictyon sp. TaxID=1846217 RepID=UPI0025DC3CD7